MTGETIATMLTSWITQFCGWMGDYLGGFGKNIGDFIKTLLFVTNGTGSSATYELSVFAYVLIFFGAFAAGKGLTRLLFGWIKSWGAR